MTACCGGAQTALEGTTWKLAEMEGIPAEAINAGADAFTLKFDAADTLVSGRTTATASSASTRSRTASWSSAIWA